MDHTKCIEKYNGSLNELCEDIGNLDYDTLAELFAILSKKFEKDSKHDLELNHPKVSVYLANISTALQKILEKDVQPMADLCRGYNQKGIK